ncbi:MAG TPA: type IV pilus secretin PilQ [Candidatus Acidoferrales bacterium]|nr:type IV pilus secretin PilQ [Candidatus Acidoferrales bacterium]
MSKIWRPFGLACFLAASLLMTTSALRADTGPSVRVTSAVGRGVVRLDAKASGPFGYTVHHPSPDLYIINLTGVTASTTDAAQVLGTNLVRSYRLEQYENGNKTESQLEILVGDGATPKVEREGPQEIVIVVSKKDVLSANSISSLAPRLVDAALHSDVPVAVDSASPAIHQISVSKDGNTPEVLVLGKRLPKPHDLRLSNPDRLVLDFASARITARRRTSSSIEPIRDVRAGQFSPEVARVVIDLSQTAPYSMKTVEGGIAVEFQSGSPSPAQQTSQSIDASVSSASAPDAAGTSAPVSSSAPTAPNAAPQDSPSAAQAAPDAQQSSTTQASTTTVPSTPAAIPPAQSSAPSVAEPTAQQPAVQQAPVQPAADTTATAPAPAPASVSAPSSVMPTAVITQQSVSGTPATKYTGAPTSLNFKDLDVLDFFRLIHELSGLNVVVDPDVKGRLTIVLDNVPWDQALDIVLKNFDLDKQVDGNVIRIATKATMKREADEERDLAKAQVEAADLVTTTRVLSYAKAGDMAETVKKFLSSRGDVLADARSNTLIISDIPSVLPAVENLINELDRRSQQVEIEARVVAANRSFSREIGSQFAFAAGSKSRNNIIGGNQQVGTSQLNRNPLILPVPPLVSGTGTAMPLVTNLGATVATSGVSYMYSSANFALDYLISAAEAKGVGKLLSKPKLVAQNNLQSKVEQGVKIPIQTVVNNTISVQFVDAALIMQVTPQITADGTIFMNIHVENTAIDPAIPRVNGIPALDTQSEDTQVTVSDGQTVMMGGVIVSNQQTQIQEVPYVGSLPIIGRLFRHTTVSTTSQELLFFITPRILPM